MVWGDGMDSINEISYMDRIDKLEWLELLMNEYGDPLTKLAYSYVKDIGRAQEIVQDVFYVSYEQYERLSSKDYIKPWLYRVTINKCKDALRSGWLKRVVLNNIIPTYFTSTNETENAIIKLAQQEDLLWNVLQLPIKYREVLLLFYYEDLSISEVTAVLKSNENTIKTRLKRGRKLLQSRLKDGDFHG